MRCLIWWRHFFSFDRAVIISRASQFKQQSHEFRLCGGYFRWNHCHQTHWLIDKKKSYCQVKVNIALYRSPTALAKVKQILFVYNKIDTAHVLIKKNRLLQIYEIAYKTRGIQKAVANSKKGLLIGKCGHFHDLSDEKNLPRLFLSFALSILS